MAERDRLLTEAAQARRLAQNVDDPRFVAMLERLAERLERLAHGSDSESAPAEAD